MNKTLKAKLLKKYGSWSGIIHANHDNLAEKEQKEIKEIKEIVLNILEDELLQDKEYQLCEPESVYNFYKHKIGFSDRECFAIVCLDNINRPICHEILFKGGMDITSVCIRYIAKRALLCNGKSIILLHNHPSGHTDPSDQDINLTKKVLSGLKVLNINVLDHLIITKYGYLSLRRNTKIWYNI